MSEIEFALSSSGLMWSEDSSTLPKQNENRGIENRFFEKGERCQAFGSSD